MERIYRREVLTRRFARVTYIASWLQRAGRSRADAKINLITDGGKLRCNVA